MQGSKDRPGRTTVAFFGDMIKLDLKFMSCHHWQVSEMLTECRRQLTRVVAVLQEVAAAAAQMVAPLAEQEGINALKLEDITRMAVDQVA